MKLSISLVVTTFLLLFGPSSWAYHIPNNEIKSFASYSYTSGSGPERTLDDTLEFGWVGTDNLQIGDFDILAYHFNMPYLITQIDFISLPDHTPYYFMGELDIQISQNTTDGFDGDWITIDHIPGSFQAPDIIFSRLVDTQSTSWVRLYMEYQGSGAWGPASPAFYLNEIDFYGTPVPEPATLLLLGTGLVGLSGLWRKFKKN